MRQCTTCGGTYAEVQPDGMQYFHRCPPLSQAEVAAAITDGTIPAPRGKAYDAYHASALTGPPPLPSEVQIQAAFLVQTTTFERKNLRDENLVSTREKDGGKIKAEGRGFTQLPDGPPRPVVVVG